MQDSEELELAFLSGKDSVELQGGTYTVFISERMQQRDRGSKRPVLRGLWYYETSNGTLCPFLEETGNILESHFSSSPFESSVVIDDQRSVRRTSSGSFEQIRSATGKVRRVVRGFLPFADRAADSSQENSFVAGSGELELVGAHRRVRGTEATVIELAQGYTQVNLMSDTVELPHARFMVLFTRSSANRS